MDRQTNRQTDRWTDEQTDRQQDRQTDRWPCYVEYIAILCPTYTFCCNEGIKHEIFERRLCGHIVEGVGGVQLLVRLVSHHRGREVVKAEHVSDVACNGVLHGMAHMHM